MLRNLGLTFIITATGLFSKPKMDQRLLFADSFSIYGLCVLFSIREFSWLKLAKRYFLT